MIFDDFKPSGRLLEIRNLKKHFYIGKGDKIKAIDGVTFSIKKGETLALVGESGCGKTTLAKSLVRLCDITEGELIFDWMNIHALNKKGLKDFTRRVQMVYQNSELSLNPYMNVENIVSEGLDIHNLYSDMEERKDKIYKILELVGLSKEDFYKFPHELSLGEKQRVSIARSLVINPDFVIFDEPLSNLDFSIQGQIIELLKTIKDKMGLTYLFIDKDLSMVSYIADRIAIMCNGTIGEIAPRESLFNNPIHPYTKALISANPILDSREKRNNGKINLKGEGQSLINSPLGCKFQERCPYVTNICKRTTPEFKRVSKNHYVACHMYK